MLVGVVLDGLVPDRLVLDGPVDARHRCGTRTLAVDPATTSPPTPPEEDTMGIDDLVSKAKGALEGREDQAKDALDKAADALKTRTDAGTDAKVDQVVEKAKDFLDDQKRSR